MRLERPILCLVTDRRRLAGGDERFETARVKLARLARDAVDAAIDLIQVRERDLETARLVDLVSELVDIARGSTTRIIVNDRLDVALACGAGGVHLRSDSIAPAAARSMAPYVVSGPSTARPEPLDSPLILSLSSLDRARDDPEFVEGSKDERLAQDRLVEGRALRAGVNRTTDVRQAPADFLVGRSVHLLAEAVEHAPAVDYLIAGTVFPTVSKPAAARLLGQSGLSQMAAAVRVPILGIGGVTVERVPAIAASGATGVAGIGMFLPSAISMRKLAAEVRAQFDRVGTTFTTGC